MSSSTEAARSAAGDGSARRPVVPPARDGVIHDIGYQRYTGPRLGRGYAARSLYAYGVRAAFGLGRGAKAKVFPWLVVAITLLIAVVLTAVRSMQGQMLVGYTAYVDLVQVLVVLFCAVVGPELVSRDLRSGVLPLYFSRPIGRGDYALAKWAALVTATWLPVAVPLVLMFTGAAFSVDGLGEVWDEFLLFLPSLGYAAVQALLFGSIAILISCLSGRRAVAAAVTAGFFILSYAVFGTIYGLAAATHNTALLELSMLLSPQTLAQGIELWLFEPRSQDIGDASIGAYGPVYGIAYLGVVTACLLLLLFRYREVAR